MSEYITVQTNPATDIQTNQMTFNGELTALDTSLFDMVVCYFLYSTSVDEDGELIDPIRIPDSEDTGLFDVGAFSFILDGLTSGTQYHFQAEGRAIAYSDSDAMDYLVSNERRMDYLVSSEGGMEAILGVSFPYEFSNATATHETDRIRITRHASENTSGFLQVVADTLIDFSEKSTLYIYARADTLGDSGGRMEAVVKIDGNEVLSLDGEQTDFILREIDVSDYSGRLLLELGYSSTNFGDDEPYVVEYGTFYLS